MVDAPTLDDVRSALAPVEALRGEQSQLETWVRGSFATLESLHDELTEWQRELTRQQADLDQRAAGVADAEAPLTGEGQAVEELQDRLARSQDDLRQLEEENAEQLQAFSDLDRQLVAAQAELRTTRKHAEDLSAALDAERQRAFDEQRLWAGELREMRRLLQRHGDMLISLGAQPPADDGEVVEADGDEADEYAPSDAAGRAAELRRRATSRRIQRHTA